MRILLRWIVGAIALYVTVYSAPYAGVNGLALQSGPSGAVSSLIAVLALTLLNATLRPILRLLTAPVNCLTLGLFSFVINALVFWLVGELGLGLYVKGFVPALYGSIVLSIVSGLLNLFIVDSDRSDKRVKR